MHDSLDIARHDLEQHVKGAHKLWDDDLSRILKAHEMMLQDQDFIRKVEIRIARELKNVHWQSARKWTSLWPDSKRRAIHTCRLERRTSGIWDT